jgi:hypothetical protein
VSALDSIQWGHVGAGALLAGVGVVATLPFGSLRRWWPAAAAAALVVGTRVAGVAPLLPHRGALASAVIVTGAAMAWLTSDSTTTLRAARGPAWVVPALLAASVAGVAAAVPDTEAAFRVAGGAVALTLLSGIAAVARAPAGPPSAWAAPAVAVVWAAGVGATGRPAAFAGTLACYGSLVALPLARRLATGTPPDRAGPWLLVLLAHGPLVVAGGRRWGLEASVIDAAVPAGLALGGLTLLFALVLGRRSRTRTAG